MTVRISVQGQDPLVRQGLASGLAALPGLLVGDLDPEAVVLDLGPFAMQSPPVWPLGNAPILALTVDPSDATAALRLGARGVLFRDGDPQRIGAAVQAVVSGMRVVDEPFMPSLLVSHPPERKPKPGLSTRERQVLDLLAEGRSNKEIANLLDFSEHTAKFHVNTLMEKLGAQSRTDVVVRAVKRGWLSL